MLITKKSSVLIFLLLLSLSAWTQEEETHETILSAPEAWGSEIIPFPLGFAPAIDYKGFEDIRFAPGWADSTSTDFWTYTFVWYLEGEYEMTEASLTAAMETYYDGLMQAVSGEAEAPEKSLCILMKTEHTFKGRLRVFDAFFTKTGVILNLQGREVYCAENNRHLVVFELSPQPFDHEVWGTFQQVKLLPQCE